MRQIEQRKFGITSEVKNVRNRILFAAVLLSMTSLASASLEPLNVKTGLWQVTMTSKIDTLPTPNTSTYQSCVKKQDLSQYPFTEPNKHCTWTVVSSTGSQMEATGTCTSKEMGEVKFKLSLMAADSENVKGTGELHLNSPGGPMNGTYTGSAKWKGATCPADLK